MEDKFKQVLLLGAVAVVTFVVAMSVKGLMVGGSLTGSANALTGNSVADDVLSASPASPASTGEKQIAKLSIKNYKYVVEPSPLKVGVPVRLEADLSTLFGCTRDVTIPAFGVHKRVTESDNIIEFTPDKTGTIKMACSMNMAQGSFQVVAADGSESDKVTEPEEPEDPSLSSSPSSPIGIEGSCGASGGGCGCGA